MRNGLTIYDGSYLALAKSLGGILYTADERLLERLVTEDGRHAKHIEDYGRPLRGV